jgi:lipid-A-disaccharide synthase
MDQGRFPPTPLPPALPGARTIFLSAGEPSGDLHGANLIRALRRLHPGLRCVGYGGELMETAGCRLLYPLCRLAVMWFLRVLANARLFLRLLADTDRFFRGQRPDAVVLIDYPGFNWNVARLAHARGIPVFYFVAPQLWAWAGWRVRKMRRWVDHVLCTLPFEEEWYRQHGVPARYIGHPYFDALDGQRLDESFLDGQRRHGGAVVGLLPGSRDQEIDRNLGTLVAAARQVHAARPDARFLVACFHAEQAERVRAELRDCPLPLEVCAGRTPEVIHLAHSCVAVSGSVGLELLYHGKPAVVVYRIGRLDLFVGNLFKTCRFISLVNLLADRELFPEYLTHRCEADAVAGHVLRWLNDPPAYAAVCGELAALRERVAQPGACDRAARAVLEVLEQTGNLPGERGA